jgi:hypothetical protein
MTIFDDFNREERAICSHLFRLLHERKADSYANGGLGQFLKLLNGKSVHLSRTDGVFDPTALSFTNVRIFTEVSLIRDAYFNSKPNVNTFMDSLTRLVMKQEEVHQCRLFSELPSILRDPTETHPKQIRLKAREKGFQLTSDEAKVFGTIQGMFNAKPDLAITIDKYLIVVEAKFTEKFNDNQMGRTRKIAEVWSDLLYESLGFSSTPAYCVIKLGASRHNPDISWSEVFSLVPHFYDPTDRSFIAFDGARKLLKNLNLE